MEDDSTIDPFDPIDNHPDHKKFYLDGSEDSSAEIATAVENAIREQHDVDDGSDVYVDTVDIDASDERFKVGATIIENEPLHYAPFGGGVEPPKATNDDVRHSIIGGEHYLWEEVDEDSGTLDGYATTYTDNDDASVTPAELRGNEVDHSVSPKEQLDRQFTYSVIETNADGCDLYVSWDKDADPAIDEINLPDGWDVCERVDDPEYGLEFIAPDTEVYAYGFWDCPEHLISRRPNIYYSEVGSQSVVWSPEPIDDKVGDKTPRTMMGEAITPKTLRANLQK